MPIERYFQQIRDVIAQSRSVQNAAVAYDRRDKNTGFLRGNITFLNRSILHVREFTSVAAGVHRLSYSYQYMNAAKQLIFRYDDADHHRELNYQPIRTISMMVAKRISLLRRRQPWRMC